MCNARIMAALLMLSLHLPTAAADRLVQLSPYVMPYSFSDNQRDTSLITGLFAYAGAGAHGLALDGSVYLNPQGEAYGQGYTGVYTYWSNASLRYRSGFIYSTSEQPFAGQLDAPPGVTTEYLGQFNASSKGLILGVFKDAYSPLGYKRNSRGLDVYICQHNTDTTTLWRATDTDQQMDVDWRTNERSERWTLQLSQHFSLYSGGFANGYTKSTLHFHYIVLNETVTRQHEHYHQLELHLSHVWPRWYIQATGAHGHAAYIYQAGGFVGYTTTDILKNGLGLEVGWTLTKNLSSSLKMQAYRYQDPLQFTRDATEKKTQFRKTTLMLTYQL